MSQDARPVGEPGQLVVAGQVGVASFPLHPFGDVQLVADEVREDAVAVQHR